MSRLALNKRVDLSKVADGWDGAYVLLRPMTAGEMAKFSKTGATQDEDFEKLMNEVTPIIKDHIVEGKVAVNSSDNSIILSDIEKSDIDDLPVGALTDIFQTLIGKEFDPKVSA